MLPPQIKKDQTDGVVILLLHLLVMTPALFGLATAHESGHGLEDAVQTSHLSMQEVGVVNLQEPVVAFVLLQ